MDASDEVHEEGQPARPARTSRLARATLICGVIALLTTCIHGGIFGMATIFLGAVTLDRLRRDPARIRGRKQAWIGIALAAVSVAIGLLLAWAASLELRRSEGELDAAIRSTLALGDATDPTPDAGLVMNRWTPQPGVTLRTEDLVHFARAVQERYGRCEKVTFEARRDEPRFDGTVRSSLDATLYFKSVKVPATVSVVRRFDLSAMDATLRIDAIVVRDGKLGDVSVPVLPLPTATSTAATPTPDPQPSTQPSESSP
jgi:hypothetical protein